jgi:hypothetical protein
MRRGSSLSPEIMEEINRLTLLPDVGGTAIHQHLRAGGFYARQGWEPNVKTIQNWARKLSPPDPSGPWTLDEKSDPEEARLVLEVLPEIVDWTHGRLWPTREMALWIARVRIAAPTIPPRLAYVVARAYRVMTAQKQDARELDLFLGLRIWEAGATPTFHFWKMMDTAFPNRQERVAEQLSDMATRDFPFFEPAVAADADAIIQAAIAALGPEPEFVPETPEETTANWEREEAEFRNQEDDHGKATR